MTLDSAADFEELNQRLERLEQVRRMDLMRELGLHRPPLRNAAEVQALLQAEFASWDEENRALVAPYLVDESGFHIREWDYAGLNTPPRELYLPCWTVAHFPSREASVVYCDHGHGDHWGCLPDDGWCGMDGAWNESFREAVWRGKLLDGFRPSESDLDEWVGTVRHLSDEEFQRLQDLAMSAPDDGQDLEDQLAALWTDYATRARKGERKVSLYLLDVFADCLAKAPDRTKQAWVERILGSERDMLKFPLLEKVAFQVLLEGMAEQRPHYARWLATCLEMTNSRFDHLLPENSRSKTQLLEIALEQDPHDLEALEQWVDTKARFLQDSLHELPSGILWDMLRGATAAECDELQEEVDLFEARLTDPLRQRYAPLIARARYYYRAYQTYLLTRTNESFASRLADGSLGPPPEP